MRLKLLGDSRSRKLASYQGFIAAGMLALLVMGCPLIPPVVPPPGVDPLDPPPSLAPGINVSVEEVTFPADNRPEIVVKFTDDAGNAVNAIELSDARFILDYLETAATGSTPRFISYTTRLEGGTALQSNYDGARQDGLTWNGDGTYTYKFADAIATKIDTNVTHQLAAQIRRDYPVDGERYTYNLVHTFRPDGQAVLATRDIVKTETCNKCHTRLAIHGGGRREVQLCIMCHSTQSTDAQSGNSLDFPQMIHKIHRGANLPSVLAGDPYQIVGFGNSVHDYSEVHFPQDIRNCAVCHEGDAKVGEHLSKPTLEGCASCHDRTFFGTGAPPEGWAAHTGGPQANNALCGQCHPATGGAAAIMTAHVLPTESDEAPGLDIDILDVIATPGQAGAGTVAIQFQLTENDAKAVLTDVTQLTSFSTVVAWPVPEYETYVRETLNAGNVVANNDGTFMYTYTAAFPSDTGETFAVGMEGRRSFTFRGATLSQGTAHNPVMAFTFNGSTPETRREIVDPAKCNECHNELRIHGSLRTTVDYCVMCHNPNETDEARRPAEAMPPETVHFKHMIHAIHAGSDLENPFTIYGFGGTPHPFQENVHFPGLRQQCTICHVNGTENLPIADEALSTMITQADQPVSEMQPVASACTACHDGLLTGIHALLQTSIEGVESCAVCHGPGAEFAVSIVHQLAP